MLEAILEAIAEAFIEAVITLIVLAFVTIIQWFLDLEENMADEDLAFTLKQRMSNGQYTVYQGIYDQNTAGIRRARRFNANRLDPKLAKAHSQDDLVVYT